MSFQRLFIITGDASGDVHGSFVIRKCQELLPQIEIQAVGGARITETGVPVFYDQRQLAAFGMGVLNAIPSHFMLGRKLIRHFHQWRPDAVLLIDYGMFNLWIAGKLKKMGIKVFYYIPPQIWASRRGRIKKIKQVVDHVFCIFPFEKALYESEGIPVTYVGHPLSEQLPAPPDRQIFCNQHGLDPVLPIIGIFPGSRRSEISHLLPAMLRALPQLEAKTNRRYQFIIARSQAVSDTFFHSVLQPLSNITNSLHLATLTSENHAILALSEAAFVASGTVTLEAALYKTPVVIAYRLSKIAQFLFRRFSYVNHIGLPNLLSNLPEGFLPEIISDEIAPEQLVSAIQPFIENTSQRQIAELELQRISTTLGATSASTKVITMIAALFGVPFPVQKENYDQASVL